MSQLRNFGLSILLFLPFSLCLLLRLVSGFHTFSIVASRSASKIRSIRSPPLSGLRTKMTTSSPPPNKSQSTLLSLPISPLAPIYHLPPDPLFPTPNSLFDLSSYEPPEDLAESGPVALKIGDPVPPSMVRRSRQVRMGGTFTYTSPRKVFSIPSPFFGQLTLSVELFR